MKSIDTLIIVLILKHCFISASLYNSSTVEKKKVYLVFASDLVYVLYLCDLYSGQAFVANLWTHFTGVIHV